MNSDLCDQMDITQEVPGLNLCPTTGYVELDVCTFPLSPSQYAFVIMTNSFTLFPILYSQSSYFLTLHNFKISTVPLNCRKMSSHFQAYKKIIRNETDVFIPSQYIYFCRVYTILQWTRVFVAVKSRHTTMP
jgi:hypothetical protein